jgi:hypothetical protein
MGAQRMPHSLQVKENLQQLIMGNKLRREKGGSGKG